MSENTINNYIAGALGGMAGIVVGHPFDTTKVQMQTSQVYSPYSGTMDALKNVYKHGMSQGLFRGMGSPLVSYGVVNSVFFGTYNLMKDKLLEGQNRMATHRETFVSGFVAGFVQLFVVVPVDHVKVVLQSQISRTTDSISAGKKMYFNGPLQCSIWIVKNHGFTGLYKGFWSMAYRDVPTFGVYTLVYEWLFKPLSTWRYTDDHGVVASLLAGGTSGVCCWTLAIPFDNVKSLVQADTKGNQFKGTLDCIVYIYKQRGFRGYFTGLPVCAMRAFPVNAVTFLIYSQVQNYLNNNGAE